MALIIESNFNTELAADRNWSLVKILGGGEEVNLFDDYFVARIIESKLSFTLNCLQKGTGVGLESFGGGGGGEGGLEREEGGRTSL